MNNTAESRADRQDAGFPAADGSSDGSGVVAQTTAVSADAATSVVRYGFRIGPMRLLVPEGIVTEVLDQPVVYPLPRGPRWLAGMLNQRGNVIPLFDLFELSGASDKPPQGRRVLLIGHSVHSVAMYVDELPQPLTASNQTAVAVSLPGMLQPFVEPAFFAQDAHWCEFDYIGFFRYLSEEGQGETDAHE